MLWRCSACGHDNLGRHKECQQCGDPKDAGEAYRMPGDTAAAPSVTDEGLLRHAKAGPDWQCHYCGSHQRRLDGRCAQCGAAQESGRSVADRPGTPATQTKEERRAQRLARRRRRRTLRQVVLFWAIVAGAPIAGVFGVFALWVGYEVITLVPPPPPYEGPFFLDAEVVARSWRHAVTIERYRIVDGEGFVEDRPSDAFDIVSQGQRHHHDEQVLDGYDTEHYTEQVPYYDTETYTEDVQCGEDCTSLPETCSETCSSDNNGFATCSTSCSGGGQSCSPRYCSETRTRQVQRFRSEPRSRQVPRYRSEPRHAEHFRWHAWRWEVDRTIVAEGTTESPHWPEPGSLAPPGPLGEGEQEREQRSATYLVTLRDITGARHEHRPADDHEFARFTSSSRHRLEVGRQGGFEILGPAEGNAPASTD